MFVARDQENLVHARQQAAVSKPLNQGVRQLQPKTPGNNTLPKTPFKGAGGNDENDLAPFGGGKQGLTVRRNQNGDNGKLGGNGTVDKRPLPTPLGPQNRAPLGLKTTNAKTNIFQTPAPPLGTIKQGRSGRKSTTRKTKQQTQPSQPIQKTQQKLEVEEDVPDIEYMPPKPKPLPDQDDYITYNTAFPQFKGRNFARGWDRIYEDNEVGKDGLTRKERETRKAEAAYDKRIDDLIREQVDKIDLLEIDDALESPTKPCAAEVERKKKAAPRTTATRSIPTVRAKGAARALSNQPKPTAPARPRVRTSIRGSLTSALTSRKKPPVPSNPSSMRHAAAVANSRSTVGYSRGRRVSSTIKAQPAGRRKETQPTTRKASTKPSILSPEKYVELYGLPPVGTEMWSKCNAAGYFDPEFKEPQPLEEVPLDYEEDEEAANFQLTL